MATLMVTPGVAAVVAAAVTAGPAYLSAKLSRGTAREEGTATREALEAVRSELRSDIAEVRTWQAAHTAEHAVSALTTTPRRLTLERRD